MKEERRVVVVKRKRFPLWAETDSPLTKKEKKSKADRLREEGKDFFVFCWDKEMFRIFADDCERSGRKPNAVLWGLISKEMGWPE